MSRGNGLKVEILHNKQKRFKLFDSDANQSWLILSLTIKLRGAQYIWIRVTKRKWKYILSFAKNHIIALLYKWTCREEMGGWAGTITGYQSLLALSSAPPTWDIYGYHISTWMCMDQPAGKENPSLSSIFNLIGVQIVCSVHLNIGA